MEDIEKLGNVITNYDEIVAGLGRTLSSNNEQFNKDFKQIVNEVMRKR